jgi:archaemetzincin
MKERLEKLGEERPDFILRLLLFSGMLLGILLLVKFGIRGYMQYQAYRIRTEAIPASFEALRTDRQALSVGEPRTWLASSFELGQTYAAFVGSSIQFSQSSSVSLHLIGEFSERQYSAAKAVKEYLSIFFCRSVVLAENIPADSIPGAGRRWHPFEGHLQYRTVYIIDSLLPRLRPKDTMFSLALTAVDLFPREKWSFVFGQASPANYSAVASLSRFDRKYSDDREFLRAVLRAVSHEAAHAINIRHCIASVCLMNGAIDLVEAEKTPLSLCPSCYAKLSHATGCSPHKRLNYLYRFYLKYGLNWEAEKTLGKLSMLPDN